MFEHCHIPCIAQSTEVHGRGNQRDKVTTLSRHASGPAIPTVRLNFQHALMTRELQEQGITEVK